MIRNKWSLQEEVEEPDAEHNIPIFLITDAEHNMVMDIKSDNENEVPKKRRKRSRRRRTSNQMATAN